jgi:hypothetical protein
MHASNVSSPIPSPEIPHGGVARHTRVTRRGRAIARVIGCATLGLALAAPGFAGGFLDTSEPKDPEQPTWAAPAKRLPVEGEGADAAEAKLKNAEMRVREAQQNAATAEWAYTRARTRRYPRGEALEEIRTRLAEMNDELVTAEREFVDIVEEARRAGVPAGTLMPYMDLADEIRRDQALRANPPD